MQPHLIYKLVLEGERPPSWNNLWSGKWRKDERSTEKTRMHFVVKAALSYNPPPEITDYPVFLLFRVYEAKRAIDYDNYILKGYTDTLVECGVLKDDNPKYVRGGMVVTYVDKNNPRVEIEIYNMVNSSLDRLVVCDLSA